MKSSGFGFVPVNKVNVINIRSSNVSQVHFERSAEDANIIGYMLLIE